MDDSWNFHQCKLCSYKTRYIHCILGHVRQHRTRSKNHRFVCDSHSPEKHQCEKCQFQSDLKVLLKEHVNTVHKTEGTHHPNSVLRYCEKCDFQTYSSLVLLSHDNRCDGSGLSAKEKNSAKLDKTGKNHSKRQRGRPPLHTNQKIDRFLQCSYCSYKTKFNGCLKSHVLWKHTPSDLIRWFKCEDCSYKSKTKTNLRTHILTKHIQPTEQEKPKCSDRSGNTILATSPSNTSLEAKLKNGLFGANNPSVEQIKRSNLKRDTAPFHTNQKKDRFFQCGYCPYESKLSGNVKTHMLWKHTPSDQISFHTNRKKNGFFRCNFCSHETKQSGNLKTHMLWKHTSLNQINWCKCDLCFYKCKDEFQLRQHVLAKHSEQSPYKTNRRDHLR